MKEVYGDIWDYYYKSYTTIICTNIGWKSDGCNVMGRGTAFQAKQKFPQLPKLYGEQCHKLLYNACFWYWKDKNIICLATKELNYRNPAISWKANSTLQQIEESLQKFVKFIDVQIECHKTFLYAVPLLGCGNGELKEEEVLPLMEKYLKKYDNVFLVRRK